MSAWEQNLFLIALAIVLVAVLSAPLPHSQATPIDQFLAPLPGYAANADLLDPFGTTTIEECLQACLNYSGPSYGDLGCIHANICAQNSTSPWRCGIGGASRGYTLASADPCHYYQRIRPRNDSRVAPAVSYKLDVPSANVSLNGGILGALQDQALDYLLSTYTVDDLLFPFRARAGLPQPPGAHCIGWDCPVGWIEGSVSGLFLMGAGGHLKWKEDPQLRAMMDGLVDGIEQCTQANGYLAAFPESALGNDEHPDYTTSWTVHGFLEAHAAGNPKALAMIRRHMNLFNNHTLLPQFLPPDGGNAPWQTPYGPPPPGWNGVNSSGYGTAGDHTIYLIVQGLIHNTRMALSDAGTQADVDLISTLYEEPWWLDMLARAATRRPSGRSTGFRTTT